LREGVEGNRKRGDRGRRGEREIQRYRDRDRIINRITKRQRNKLTQTYRKKHREII